MHRDHSRACLVPPLSLPEGNQPTWVSSYRTARRKRQGFEDISSRFVFNPDRCLRLVTTMPSIKSFTMTLDALNESGTFSEGDTLSGTVTLDLIKEIAVQSLYVKAKGDANVRWSQKSGDKTYTYSANRRYFKVKQFLVPVESKGRL